LDVLLLAERWARKLVLVVVAATSSGFALVAAGQWEHRKELELQ